MIEANKSAAFGRLFGVYNTRLLQKHFAALHLGGEEHIAELDRSLPVILAGNHSCWWDGLVEYYLATEVFDADIYLMMEEKQMTRYRFFRRVGAFSVDRDIPRRAVESMRYAASLFKTPNRFLWIYPQGEMLPNDRRPLRFFPGVGRIVQLTGKRVQVVPFARRYEFLMAQRPEVFTLVGPRIDVDVPADHTLVTKEMEEVVTGLLDTLRCRVAAGDTATFRTVLRGARSTNQRYDALRMK